MCLYRPLPTSTTSTDLSRPQLIQRPRKRDRFPNMRDAANPGDRALDAESKSRVHEGAVFPQVEIPAVRLFWELLRADPREQLVVVVFALAAADDLPVPFRRQQVVVQHGARVRRVFLHIE